MLFIIGISSRMIFIATGPRTGQHIRIDTPDGVLPDPIAFADPLEADDSTEGVRDVRRVDADSPDSTSYKLIVVTPFGWRFLAPLLLGSSLNPINSSMLATGLGTLAGPLHGTEVAASEIPSLDEIPALDHHRRRPE